MKHILCYGDSNTWGLIAGTTRRYPVEKRWTGLLQRLLGFENAHVIEEGLCGRTCAFEDASRLYRNGMTMLPFLLETHAPLDNCHDPCYSCHHLCIAGCTLCDLSRST